MSSSIYDAIYNTFSQNVTNMKSQEDILEELGTLTPDVNTYTKTVVGYYLSALYGGNAPVVSVGDTIGKKTRILNDIFTLIVSMLSTLQKVASVQSSRLNFLSAWQNGYTELQNKLQTWTSAGPGAQVGQSSSSSATSKANQHRANIRGEMNTTNQTYTEQIKNRRSSVSTDAQALQSTVNNSNDLTNQQADLATAILQQLSTILNSIYPSS